jgi:hypothetical protein
MKNAHERFGVLEYILLPFTQAELHHRSTCQPSLTFEGSSCRVYPEVGDLDEVSMRRRWAEVSRREERIYVTLPVTLRTGWEGATVVNGNTVDYSERGLRVCANVPFQVRQAVEVIVSDNPKLARNYSVMWVREPVQGQSLYEAGLAIQGDRLV